MATYIQGLYDSPLSVTPFTPDYSFIQTALKTKEAEYEQGFAQVKNLYNSLLNSKVSNDGNAEVQKSYLADAERKLQSLASVDLSAPQNVSMARSVFKTYLNDNELMHDININKISDSQLAIGQSFLQSEDPKKRAMHSSIADEYVSTVPVNELKWAKRGDGSITKVRPRYYVPAVNLSEKFKDFMDASKYTAFTETRNGAGIIFKTTDGKVVEKGLYNLMNGLLTPDDRKYFEMWGEVVYNRGLNQYVQQGVPVEEARASLAEFYYNNDVKLFKDQKAGAESDLKIVKSKIDEYGKKAALTVSEQQEVERLLLTEKEYQKGIDELGKSIDDLTSKKEETYQKYYDGKWGVIANQLLHTSISSIAKGMGILTNKSEIKADDSYYKSLEAQTAWYNAQTARMKAGEGDGAGTTGTGGKVGKMSEAEYKRAVANQPLPSDIEKRPEEEYDKVRRVWENRKELHNIIMTSGNNLVEKFLSDDFNGQGTSIGVLTAKLKKMQDEDTLSQPVAEFPNTWTWGHEGRKGTVSDSPEKRAFDNFLRLYGVSPDGKGTSGSPFMTYLQSKGKDAKGATYADVSDFLIKKANETYENKKSTMSDRERMTLEMEFQEPLNRAKNFLKFFEEDQKKIESNILTRIGTILDEKKYDTQSLVITDDAGFRRFATKEELAKMRDDANTVVGYTSISTPGATGGMSVTSRVPIFKMNDNARRQKLNKTFEEYDQINEKLNTTVADYLVANKFSLDEKTLKTFGTYVRKSDPQVQGELAEQDLPILLSDNNLAVSTDIKKSALDIRPIVDEAYPNAKKLDKLREIVGEIQAGALAGDWSASIQYKQTTGDKGDNRKEYVVKFAPEKINSLISHYSSDATKDEIKVEYLTRIKANGLEIRTNTPVPGGRLSEHDLEERIYTAQGYYESPEEMSDLYKYRINKKGDGSGYYLSSDSYYNYKDPTTGERKKMSIPSDILSTIPPNSSIGIIKSAINGLIYANLSQTENATEENLRNPGNSKVTVSDIKKQLGL